MQSWKRLLSYKPVEFSNQELAVTKGQLPNELQGILYRNTAAIFKRKNGFPGHLFDGVTQFYFQDGVILKVQFQDGKAIGSYKHVQSEQFQQEQQRNEFIYAGLGRTHTGNFLTKIFNTFAIKNVANTSVLPLKQGNLLALWEGELPTALQKSDLNTLGRTNGGALQKGDTFSAHPKVDPKTGLIYNVGITHGRNEMVNVFEMDQTGKILKRSNFPMNGRRFILHDFVLAGDYLVVLLYYQFVTDLSKIFLGLKAFGENVLNDDTQGIQVLVFDRSKNLECIANKINYKKFFSWHYSNGYVDSKGNVVTQLISYPNFDFYFNSFVDKLQQNGYLDFQSSYDRLTINPKSGEIVQIEKLSFDSLEFPVVHDQDVGVKQDITYAIIQERKDDWFNGVIRIDENDYKNSVKKFLEPGRYLTEALFVQNQMKQKGSGWLIYLVFDGNVNKSFVEIVDSLTLELVSQLECPQLISLSFHGRFEYTLNNQQ